MSIASTGNNPLAFLIGLKYSDHASAEKKLDVAVTKKLNCSFKKDVQKKSSLQSF